ncbi:MAG: branched-chain amino acid ABC transporter substrate-binding protein [Alphaproteobacteria bacterium]|nr:branched-chain amino acid ABC transporter substrate-binding protein [Alphaproteobacteria bacterium]
MKLSRTSLSALVLCTLLQGSFAVPAAAQPVDEGLHIGVLAPEEGNFKLLGDEINGGVTIFASSVGGLVSDVVREPDTCDATGGADAASAFVEAGVDAVIGFLCMESLAAALPILSSSGIPAISLGVRSKIIAEDAAKNGWLFYRMAPRADDEERKIAEAISSKWLGRPLALIEDGTIYGRELAESVRLLLEEVGITPVFTDNYRPSQNKQFGLVRRLERAGASHVFIGGDRLDAAIIARDSREAELNLTFMGGDALNAADSDPTLVNGFLAVTLPDPVSLSSARNALVQFENTGRSADGYALPAYAAGQILLDAKRASVADDTPLAQTLTGRLFETAVGPVEFDDFGERKDNPFRLMVWRNGNFSPVDRTNENSNAVLPEAAE